MQCVESTLGALHSNYAHVGVLGSLCYRFCYRFHAWCKWDKHAAQQCCSKPRLQWSKPSHLCPSTYPPRAVMHWPRQFGTVGFLLVCVHAFSSHHFSHVKGFPQESSGVIVFFISSLSFYRGLGTLPDSCMFFCILSHLDILDQPKGYWMILVNRICQHWQGSRQHLLVSQ